MYNIMKWPLEGTCFFRKIYIFVRANAIFALIRYAIFRIDGDVME